MWTKNITIALIVIGLILVIPGIIGLVLSVTDKFPKGLVYAEITPPYEIKHTQLVPLNVFNQFTKGITLPVKIDHKNPERVVIMWE